MTEQVKPPILNIQMVPAGVELAIAALRKLPHEQVDPLVQELWAQYKQQMQSLAEVQLTAPDDTEGGEPE
jgi:hypothetical protein